MLSKTLLLVSCLYLVQASFVDDAEQQENGASQFAAVLSRSRRSCGAGECNAHCKRLGHARGVCIGTYCQCRSRLRRAADELAENNEEKYVNVEENLDAVNFQDSPQNESEMSVPVDMAKSRSARATCGYDECNRFCRKLGHARGVCIGNYCQCRFRRRRSLPEDQTSQTNAVEPVLSRSRRSCGARECNAHCIRLGHVRGVCIGTYCQCRSL